MVDQSGDQVQIAVEDDGAGFQIAEVFAEGPGHRNMGIANMRQQVEGLLGGQFGMSEPLPTPPGRTPIASASIANALIARSFAIAATVTVPPPRPSRRTAVALTPSGAWRRTPRRGPRATRRGPW